VNVLGWSPRSLSVHSYLFGMAIAILLPVLFFAALLFWRYCQSELDRIEQELKRNASDLALIIDRDLQGEIVSLETLSTSSSMKANDFARFYERAARFRDYAGVDILLRDLTGQQLVNTRAPWGTALPLDKAAGDDRGAATDLLHHCADSISPAFTWPKIALKACQHMRLKPQPPRADMRPKVGACVRTVAGFGLALSSIALPMRTESSPALLRSLVI
jgi:hypothetical protein